MKDLSGMDRFELEQIVSELEQRVARLETELKAQNQSCLYTKDLCDQYIAGVESLTADVGRLTNAMWDIHDLAHVASGDEDEAYYKGLWLRAHTIADDALPDCEEGLADGGCTARIASISLQKKKHGGI